MPKRINAIPTEATDFAEDDFVPIDGAASGTRKVRLGRRVLAGDVTRAVSAFCLSDGGTPNRRAELTPGAHYSGGLPTIFPFEFDWPVTPPTGSIEFLAVCASGTSTPSSQDNTLVGWVGASDGAMWFRQRSTAGNGARLYFVGAHSVYAGRRARGALVVPAPNTAAKPSVVILGQDVTSSFTQPDEGTAPLWLTTAMVTTRIVSGYNWSAGGVVPHAPIIGTMTTADVVTWTTTGVWPSWFYASTGSAVPNYQSNFATTDGWTNANGGVVAANGGRLEITTGPANAGATRTMMQNPGRYLHEIVCRLLPGSTGGPWEFGGQSAATELSTSYFTPTETDQTFSFTSDRRFNAGIFLRPASGAARTATLSIASWRVTPAGPIARPFYQPGCQVAPDSGANGLPMLLAPGMTAVGDIPDHVVIPGNPMTADGFILADQVLTDNRFVLVDAYARQTGTATSTITIRETSSGGTTVATGALSASTTRVQLAVSNGLSAGGKKLHLTNSAWGGNTVTPFLVFRRCQMA